MSRRLDTLLLITALLATMAYGLADANLPILVVGITGVLGAWGVARARGGRPLGYGITIPLTLAAVGYALLRLVAEGFRVGVFSEFVLALIVVKMVDRRTTRDTGQALLLIVFLVIGAILTSNRLGLGLILLVFIPVISAAVITQQIEYVREMAGAGESVRRPSVRTRLDLRRLVWTSSLASLLISVVVFVVMPRGVGMQAFGAWGNTSVGAQTGFNDEVELGRGGLISQSTTPVLDLQVFDEHGNNEGSPTQSFLLRGAVLEEYDDGLWRRHTDKPRRNERSPIDVQPNTPVYASPETYDRELRVTIRNAAQHESHLFTIWKPVQIELHQPARLRFDRGDRTYLRVGQRGKFEYTVWCRNAYDPATLPPVRPAPYPTFPSERIRELAAQILQNREDPIDPDPATRPIARDQEAARRFEWYLATSYPYTLETLRAPVGMDPTEWFLFESEQGGHCEYFASALAGLCRSVGIDARVVTGYVANEWNEPTSHYMVRESDAHAWVEVQVVPGGSERWMALDATPESDFRQIHEPSQALGAKLRRMLDTLEYAWINTVVGYNRRSRSEIVDSSIDSAVGRFSERLGDRLRQGGAGLALRALGAGMIAFAASMGVGFAVLALARRRGWRPGPLVRRLLGGLSARLSGVLRRRTPDAVLHDDMLLVLDRGRRPKPDWRPLLSHAGGLGPASEPASRLARTVYRARFGARPLSPDDARRARADLAALRDLLRRPRRPR